MLLVELSHPTWRVLEWDQVKSKADLLATKAQQLKLRDEDIEEVALRKRRKRAEGKEAFDGTHQLRTTEIKVGDIVLRHNIKPEIDMSVASKLVHRWLGPYRVQEAVPDKGTYKLKELDGTPLSGTYAGNRLKAFIKRESYYRPVDPTGDDNVSDLEEESSVDPAEESLLEPTDFIIRPPQLSEAQKGEYALYEEDDDTL